VDVNAAWEELMYLISGDEGLMPVSDVERAQELVDSITSWVQHGGLMPEGVQVGRTSFCVMVQSIGMWLGIVHDLNS
jgi:hypothetical protein